MGQDFLRALGVGSRMSPLVTLDSQCRFSTKPPECVTKTVSRGFISFLIFSFFPTCLVLSFVGRGWGRS